MGEKILKLIYLAMMVAIFYFAFPLFLPFILAIIVAVVFEPLILFLMKQFKIKRIWASLSVLTLFFILVFYLLYYFIAYLIKEVISFVSDLPSMVDTLFQDNQHLYELYLDLPSDTKDYLASSLSTVADKLTSFVSYSAAGLLTMAKSFPGYFVAILILIIATYIISLEMPSIKQSFLRFFEEGSSREKVNIILDKLKLAVVGFLQAQLVLSVLTFVLSFIGLLMMGMEFVVVPSLFIVIVDLLPILGTGSVLIPWSIYVFIVGDLYQGIGLLILFVVITVVRRIIEPKILANKLGISPLATLISMYIGLSLMGIMGMIIAPVILIVIQTLEESKFLTLRIKF